MSKKTESFVGKACECALTTHDRVLSRRYYSCASSGDLERNETNKFPVSRQSAAAIPVPPAVPGMACCRLRAFYFRCTCAASKSEDSRVQLVEMLRTSSVVRVQHFMVASLKWPGTVPAALCGFRSYGVHRGATGAHSAITVDETLEGST